MATIKEARAAKDCLKEQLKGVPGVLGIGLTEDMRNQTWAVQVLVLNKSVVSTEIPETIDDVQVLIQTTGPIKSL